MDNAMMAPETKEQRRTRLIEQYAGQICMGLLSTGYGYTLRQVLKEVVALADAVITETEEERK